MHGIHDPPIDQAEVTAVAGDVELREERHQAIEGPVAGALEGVLLAIAPLGVDDVEPLSPPLQHLEDELRRVLKVRIQDCHDVPVGVIEPRRQRIGMPKVPREPVEHEALVGRGACADDLRRAVAASVVDDAEADAFDAVGAERLRREDFIQASKEER